jgi:hypothetical protein
MDQAIVVLVTVDHVPDEIGGSFADACQALDLDTADHGYVLYLLDVMNQRSTVIGTHTDPVCEALADHDPGSTAHLVCDLTTVMKVVHSGTVADARAGWPEEFGGGPRCQFCRAPEPGWVYEGADVEVLLGESFMDDPPPLLGTDITGCIDWHACGQCRELIDTRTQDAWRHLLARFDDGGHVPMPVQAAWREFWGNHRRAQPADPPPWTPGRRRFMANQIRTRWDDFVAACPLDKVVFTDLDVPELAGVDTVVAAANAYLNSPPPPGRIRRYPTETSENDWIIRADGDDWTLVGRTSHLAFVLLDDAPEAVHTVKGPQTTMLLDSLARAASPAEGAEPIP